MTVFLDPIYKRDAKGAIRVWRAEVDLERGAYCVHAGHLGGQQVTSAWTDCIPKSQATPGEQAMFEALSDRRKKLDRGYVETVEDVDTSSYLQVQLAENIADFPIAWGESSWHSQPKLDGMRCVAPADGLWTRRGKPIVSVPHVEDALAAFRDRYPDEILDGELYNHDFRDEFQGLMSLCRKEKVTPEVAAQTRVVQFHVYDIVSPEPFEERFRRLRAILAPFLRFDKLGVIRLVKTTPVDNHAQMIELFDHYLDLGYEGQILRRGDVGYEHKRSQACLKHKPYETAEFPVKAILPGTGNWAGIAKKAIVDLGEDGGECEASLRGTQAENRKLLKEADKYVGGECTVEFLGRTKDRKLRCGVVKDWHPNGRMD